MIKRTAPLLVLLLAFWLQTQYLAELRAIFPGSFTTEPFCGVDAGAMLYRASGLLDGSVPGDKPYFFIPLYPVYLALLKITAGDSLLLPIYVQAMLQLAGIAATYAIGRRLFSPLTGLLAALGMATYSYYIFYLPCFDQSLLTVPFLTVSIFLLLIHFQSQKTRWLPAAGITLALAALSRPTILLLYPVIILWLLFTNYQYPKGTSLSIINYQLSITKLHTPSSIATLLKSILFLILPFIIFVSPITWHNYRASGQFMLLTDNAGVNLFTGNNPDATGLDSLAHVQSQPAVVRFQSLFLRVGAGETTLTAEVWRYITEQPVDWLALTARKIWLWFWESDERLVSPFFPLLLGQSQTLSVLPLEWRAVAVVALLGLLLARGKSSRQTVFLWLVYGVFSLATIIFFIQLRFRLPLLPFALVFAAACLASAPAWRQQRPLYFWSILIALLLLYPLVSSLWIFIMAMAVLGLWPRGAMPASHLKPQNQAAIVILAAICLYLLGVGMWLKTQNPDASQTIDHYLGPPLVAEGVIGQTFEVDCNDLNRIDVTMGVFERSRHDQPVTFYLAADLPAQEILYSETFAGESVEDYQTKRFTFPSIANSAGRTFFFFLQSPTSTPDNALTLRGYTDTPVDRYPAGSAFAGQVDQLRQFQADLAFAAFCD